MTKLHFLTITIFIFTLFLQFNNALTPKHLFTQPQDSPIPISTHKLSDFTNAKDARNHARVQFPKKQFEYIPSEWQNVVNMEDNDMIDMGYAGYITVNQTYDSNTFFWFIPALNGDANAPLLMWMNGGPGATSMYGLFEELGPFSVDASGQNLVPRNVTWNTEFAVVYVDNPVGTGFSYTMDTQGYSTNQDDVATNLYSFLTQFFGIFPDYADNEFFVTGESYAGKYVPSISHRIILENRNPTSPFINLQGMSIGDGIMSPIHQMVGFGDLLYSFGMASRDQYNTWIDAEQQIVTLISTGKLVEAFRIFDYMLNGDFFPYPTFYHNTTGLTDYFNFLQPDYPPNNWQTFINLPSTRKAINVGDHAFNAQNSTVEYYLLNDWFRGVEDILPETFANTRVLVYNGQNDIILSSSACLNFLNVFDWPEGDDWRSQQRFRWALSESDSAPAGYIHQSSTGNFTYAMVRDAGHLLPQDQPYRALDMITRFVKNMKYIPFESVSAPHVASM
jgi:vitellogenic carboxypeptidase-like protein